MQTNLDFSHTLRDSPITSTFRVDLLQKEILNNFVPLKFQINCGEIT